jgi:hypothetical protein
MQPSSLTRLARAITRPVAAMAACLPLLAMAAPTLTGPSVAKVSEAAVFSGSGYVANSAVSISVTQPGGTEAQYSAVVAADGTLSYGVAPAGPGVHTLKVLDSGGATLTTTIFHAIQ